MTTTTNPLIRPDEILDLGEYERRRDTIRKSAMQARALRRIHLGPNATIAFENRETILYQIHEMCRAERLAKPDQVAHEIETYAELLPSSRELAGTLLIEFPEKEERDQRLRELLGLEDHLRIDVDGVRSKAVFDKRQIDVERLSSVQFLRFALSDEQRQALAEGKNVILLADHVGYRHETKLPPEIVQALSDDLTEIESVERG